MPRSGFVPQPAEGLTFPNALDMFAARVRRTPAATALRYKLRGSWHTLQWRDWHQASRAIAAALVRIHGVQPGDRIAILARTRVEWALVDLAIAMTGAVSVPIYPSVTPEQAAYILRDCGAQLAFADSPGWPERLRGRDHALRHTFCFDEAGPLAADWSSFEALQTAGEGALPGTEAALEAIAEELSLTDDFTWVYTSGTTGRPKGAVLTHRNVVYEAWAIKSVIAADHADEQLMVLPLAHVFGRHLLWGAVEQGAVSAFAADPAELELDLVAVAPTFMGAVPQIYERLYAQIRAEVAAAGKLAEASFAWCLQVGRKVSMCRQRGQAVPGALAVKASVADKLFFARIRQRLGGRLRFFVSGGAPLAREVAEFFHALGVLILEGYGLSETTGACTVNRPDRFRFGTVGPTMPGCELRIADDGEVLVRGPGVMRGYHDLPEETAAAIDAQGWLHTGDIGELHDGFLTITDRKKDLIITSTGKTIAPQPLERRLELAEGIAHALVVGDGRPYLAALIALDEEAMLARSRQEGLGARRLADLVRHPRILQIIQGHIDALNADLASYEAIRRFSVVTTPLTITGGELTPTGKLRRREVQDRYAAQIAALYPDSGQRAVAG
ncbi:AMP-dependent synthetase/ligase [Nannocystis pusilla]|uniref:AMP-dependent synthetase/ligase n=1 Tax=Nannocystis pusilla TaxID=889268 RepID=A0A9X3EL32_9BACT|nr:AMP-dependent synthetase/ligase [Nannocystis pusilla]MCY1006049.1 AMP-dependent synthetase/ligase [Nannocystis pusilla]